ncbi:hypothetical protein A3463_08620 [Enterobacter chengduensis]|uniref:helix-turn-helix domain-containing protein n=1 Tax=Enterobacter chengduensis TaxID=2494701 RepID=UPI0007B328F0|nr:helix-turn-helix transcriptional regulator [Enterobacter chengduensis]KZP90989.1 hypothetical protein A3463_08620 [Enterobacter chengduensis]
MKIHILTANTYLRIGLMSLVEQLGYVVNIIKPDTENYFDEVNSDDLVVFHADRKEPLLISKILDFNGKTKLMLIGSRKLSLERLCSINEVVDELTPIDKLLSALKRAIKAQEYNYVKYKSLSEKERVILMKTLSGVTANAIAEQFGLSNKTIYALKKNAFRKLGAKNIHEILPLKNIILEQEIHHKLKFIKLHLSNLSILSKYYDGFS